MNATKRFLAFDIGASNGRAVLGKYDGKRLECEDIYHFTNEPVMAHGSLFWDVLRLFGEVENGLSEYVKKYGSSLDGIGIDTWGVDFGLLDKHGDLLGNPYHHRDKLSKGCPEQIKAEMDAFEIYSATGVQLEQVSTICQLYALAKNSSPELEIADSLLMMPSLLAYFLTGEIVDEHSNISNTALYGYQDNAPVSDIFSRLGIPHHIMPKVVRPGSILGKLGSDACSESGLDAVSVFAPATHDTASAVISVPADPATDWAFLSCGTWSVMGIETDSPITSRQGFELGITSAATADGKYMPRLNITGLWILQRIRRFWEKRGEGFDWGELVKLAEEAEPFAAIIDVDDPSFISPPDMPAAVLEYIAKTGQTVPENKRTLVRIVLESLALKYREKLSVIERAAGHKIQVLHIVGGGARNRLLCQFTADALGIPVLAGPVEATSMGNLLVQMVGSGIFESIAQGRQALKSSMDVVKYRPVDTGQWNEAYERYLKIAGRG